jgi:hypothetical protein
MLMNLEDVLKEMQTEGMIRVVPGLNYYGTPQTNFAVTAVKEDSEEIFNAEELLTIEEVNKKYLKLKPGEIRQLSHLDFPYKATKSKGDAIAYSLVNYRDDDEEDEVDEEASKLFASDEFVSTLKKVEAKL